MARHTMRTSRSLPCEENSHLASVGEETAVKKGQVAEVGGEQLDASLTATWCTTGLDTNGEP